VTMRGGPTKPYAYPIPNRLLKRKERAAIVMTNGLVRKRMLYSYWLGSFRPSFQSGYGPTFFGVDTTSLSFSPPPLCRHSISGQGTISHVTRR